MAAKIFSTPEVQDFLRLASGLDTEGGSPRTKQIVHRILDGLARLGIIPSELLQLAPHSLDFVRTRAASLRSVFSGQALGSRNARSSAV